MVSRYLTPEGLAGRLLSLWRAHQFELLVSEPILAEVGEVLLRPRVRARHQPTDDQVGQIIDGFRQFGTSVAPTESIQASVDPDDDIFLERAVASGADAIVTRDPHLLDLRQFRGVRMLSPAAFIASLEADGPG